MRKIAYAFRNLFLFYYEGFRNMSGWGKKVWLVILIKLFIIFVVLRLFFFPDLLKTGFRSDAERSTYVRNQILNINR
jgi:uncharacterized membrane protein